MIKETIKSLKGFGSDHNGKSFVMHLGGFVTQLQKEKSTHMVGSFEVRSCFWENLVCCGEFC
jgi:hypothetical protein